MALASLPKYVAAPGLVAPRFGLLSVIQWQDSSDPHAMLGIQYEPLTCGPADLTSALQCADEPESPFGVPKETEAGVPLVVASPFAVYGSYECNPVGRPLQEAFDRARQHLDTGKGRAIERAVQLGEAGNEPALVSEAVDITPAGGAVTLTAAFAEIEQYLRENYAGTGVIHVSPRVATIAHALMLVYTDGEVLRTPLGTQVAVGAGYEESAAPTSESPDPDATWIYATGAVYGWQSEAPNFPDSPGGAINRENNTLITLAEQVFVIAWECVTAAIQVNLSESIDDSVTVSGNVGVTSLPSAQRTTTITRLTVGADRTIPAGTRSYTVTVVAAASAASPTLDGVALPVGYTATFSAPENDTLEAAEVATVAGDDVIVLEVS